MGARRRGWLALALAAFASAACAPPPSAVTSQLAATDTSAPQVIARAVWGAREPACQWDVADKLTHAEIHHTYEPTEPPSIPAAYRALREIQDLHMDQNGWCDIGYNYLIDWFGNVYEGAAGSIAAPVIGANTAGFNREGAGIALIGNYSSAHPTPEAIEAAGRVAGWALGWYGVGATDVVQLIAGGGNNRFAAGTVVTVPAITGHRDLYETECPGDGTYPLLGEVVDAAEQITLAMQAAGAFSGGVGTGQPIFQAQAAPPTGPTTPADSPPAPSPPAPTPTPTGEPTSEPSEAAPAPTAPAETPPSTEAAPDVTSHWFWAPIVLLLATGAAIWVPRWRRERQYRDYDR